MEITARAIIEIAGYPAEHVEKTMNDIITKIKAEDGMQLMKKNIPKVEKTKELWSTFADLELKFRNLEKLFAFCFNYMPSSIEIIHPEEIKVKNIPLADMLNDMLAKLHHATMILRNLQAENVVLKRKLQQG